MSLSKTDVRKCPLEVPMTFQQLKKEPMWLAYMKGRTLRWLKVGEMDLTLIQAYLYHLVNQAQANNMAFNMTSCNVIYLKT